MVTRFACILSAMLVITASPAWACGILEHADPKVGSAVATPDHLTLTFSQAIVPTTSSVQLTDASGHPMPTGKLIVSHEESIVSLKPTTPLPPGKYKVTWNIEWKDCGNQTQGTYKFTVLPRE